MWIDQGGGLYLNPVLRTVHSHEWEKSDLIILTYDVYYSILMLAILGHMYVDNLMQRGRSVSQDPADYSS